MPMRIMLSICALLTAASGASASIWEWGCQGQLGPQQVIFNRESLVVVDAQQKMGDVRTLRMSKIELPPGSPPSVAYDPIGDDGFTKTMEFAHHDDPKRKLVLTEKSSKKISKSARLVCGRNESNEITRKVYRYQRENEPVRGITMQCREYELSTRGGRKGCD